MNPVKLNMSENQLNNDLVKKAVKALYAFELKQKKEKNESLVEDYAKPILAQVQLTKKIAKKITKPVRVKIPNTLFNIKSEDHTICLFCKSDNKKSIEKYLESNPIDGLIKILSIDDVKKHYVQFKDRKKLLKEHTHFITDSPIMGQLYNLLGKVFSQNNNYPIPIDLPKIDSICFKVIFFFYSFRRKYIITYIN